MSKGVDDYIGQNTEGVDEDWPTDDPFACPDCKAHMVKIGIDLYRCTKCGETWNAHE